MESDFKRSVRQLWPMSMANAFFKNGLPDDNADLIDPGCRSIVVEVRVVFPIVNVSEITSKTKRGCNKAK